MKAQIKRSICSLGDPSHPSPLVEWYGPTDPFVTLTLIREETFAPNLEKAKRGLASHKLELEGY